MAPRVVVDGYGLEDGSEFRGIGTYLRQLISGLASRPDIDLAVIAGRRVPLPETATRVSVSRLAPRRWREREHALRLPGAIARARADLLHSASQTPPTRSTIPWVQTLQDLTPLIFRDPLLEPDRARWLRVGPRLHDAAAVICPSRSSADQAIELLHLPAEKIHVVPLGVSSSFTADGPTWPASTPYLLWVSSWAPHKGLRDACSVIAGLAERGYPHRLVVAGTQDPFALGRLRETVAAAERPDLVDVLGFVDDLGAVYRGATALVVSSRAEGFGLPVVEGFACGTPVVSYDNTSLPEVVGDAGLLVPDGDITGLQQAVVRVIEEPDLAAGLRDRGLARAATFSWQATIAGHVSVYREVLSLSDQ